MERFMAIAHRVIPAAGSEWPLTEFGRVFATDYAADVIRAEFEALLAEIKVERDEADRAAGAAQRKLDALLAERLATPEAA